MAAFIAAYPDHPLVPALREWLRAVEACRAWGQAHPWGLRDAEWLSLALSYQSVTPARDLADALEICAEKVRIAIREGILGKE